MGHAGRYWEQQPELAVWRLLYGVWAVILRLGGLDSSWSAYVLLCRFPWIVVGISGCGFQISMSFCGAAVLKLKRTVGGVWKINFNNFSLFLWPNVSLSFGELFQLVSLCEGRKSCDTGMRRYYHGKRKVHYQGRAMLMITYNSLKT